MARLTDFHHQHSSDNMMKPYVEYRGVYGGGTDERSIVEVGRAAPRYALEVR
jgi:hypothetical protein